MGGAEAASSSTSILLGLQRPLHGGITSTKRDSYLESKLHDSVHEINNLYPPNSYKTERNILKIVSSNTNKIIRP